LAYLAQAPVGWTAGWTCWMVCAVLLVTWLAVVVHRLGEGNDLARLGLVIAVAALVIDLSCDLLFIVGFPRIAAGGTSSEAVFVTVERVTGAISLVVANGGYSVAILFITRCLQRDAEFGIGSVLLGYATSISGLALAAAGITGVPWHAEWATPAAIGFYCLWVVVLAHDLAARRLR
jgi:hypothetical protein